MKGKLYKSVKSREEIESSQLFSTMLQKVGSTGAVVIDGKNLMADSIYARHIRAGEITTDHLVVGVATADLINTGGLEITDELKVVHGDKDVLFINRDGVLEMNISALKIGLVDFEKDINTEIKAIAGSWSQLNLNNAGDIISGINANDKGTNIHGKNISLTGDTDVQGDFKVSGNQVVLNANTDIRGDFKVSGGSVILDANTDVKGDFKVDGNAIIDGTLSANKIRTGVISAASGTSTLNMDTGDMVMGGNFNLGNGALEWDKVTKTLDIRVNKLTIGQYPAASTKDIKDVDEKYKGQSLQDKGYIEGTEIFTDKADNSVVHVEIDGKSYQGGEPTPDHPIEIHSLNDFDVVSSVEKLTEGQLEEYDYDSEYENVDKINLSLSEPLRSVGDIKDRLFRDIDGLWKIERNMGEHTTDGTDIWSRGASSGGWNVSGSTSAFYSGTLLNKMKPSRNINSITNRFPVGNSTDSNVKGDNEEFTLGYASWGVIFRIEKSKLTTDDAAGFTGWIASNPVTIIYQLATPFTEILDQELQDKLNNLRSFQNSNYVYTIINDKTDIISENLKPQIHTKFKGGGWYNRWKTSEAVNDIDAKINNAVTTIDGTGVTVKDGNFFLEDDSSSEKYSLKIKTNLITDHGIEFVSPTTAATNISGGATFNMAKEVYSGSHNNVYSHMPTGNIDIWSIGSPYLYVSYLPNDFVNADYTPIFGATSGVVNNQNYFEAKVDSRISKNTTYTFSAHFKKHPNMTGSYPKIEVFQRKKQSTLEYRLASETFSYTSSNEDVIRYSVTFTTNNEFSTGMYFLRLRVTSSNSNYVMVDGLQLVEGNHPVQYHSEDTASFYQRDNRTQISGLQFDVRQLQSNKPIHSQGTGPQGKWIRFEDGMAIAEYWGQTFDKGPWSQWGSMWYSYLQYHWDFPITFLNPPAVSGSTTEDVAFVVANRISISRASDITMYRPVSTSALPAQWVYLTAIGRWKN